MQIDRPLYSFIFIFPHWESCSNWVVELVELIKTKTRGWMEWNPPRTTGLELQGRGQGRGNKFRPDFSLFSFDWKKKKEGGRMKLSLLLLLLLQLPLLCCFITVVGRGKLSLQEKNIHDRFGGRSGNCSENLFCSNMLALEWPLFGAVSIWPWKTRCFQTLVPG